MCLLHLAPLSFISFIWSDCIGHLLISSMQQAT
jgi:hypothetical protein